MGFKIFGAISIVIGLLLVWYWCANREAIKGGSSMNSFLFLSSPLLAIIAGIIFIVSSPSYWLNLFAANNLKSGSVTLGEAMSATLFFATSVFLAGSLFCVVWKRIFKEDRRRFAVIVGSSTFFAVTIILWLKYFKVF
ncbi:MAG: hypothetical protein HY764_03425 [Candidatus Portnoybacteria bacterium]|nr:hypothetical protein [Candidatus Portnoybacteria bacterium]